MQSRKSGRRKEETMFDMTYSGRKIAEARKEMNITQMELADRLNISYQAVSNWERGISMPDISKLPELSEILDISVDEILGKKSNVIENLMKNKAMEDVKMEEIIEAAPLLKPEQVDEAVKNSDDISEIAGVLPFLSTEFVDELFSKASDEGSEKVGMFLPFASITLIDKAAENCYSKEGLSAVCKFAPFMSDDMLVKLADETYTRYGLNEVACLAPFIPSYKLNEWAAEVLDKHGISGISPIAPFIDEKIIESFVREKYLK